MAIEATIRSASASATPIEATPLEATSRRETTARSVLRAVLMPLASLKLTVALLAAGLFLVFIGTLAQTRYDIWEVVHKYFRTPFSWVEFRVFFPESFFPEWSQFSWSLDLPFGWKLDGFPYPGGLLLGILMFVNLLAAHSVRFTVQSRGLRLAGGLLVIALGLAVTGLVIMGGEDREGVQTPHWISYDTLWLGFKWGVVLLAAGAVAATVLAFRALDARRQIERWGLLVVSVILAGVAGYLLLAGDGARMSDPSMRILSQIIAAGFAGLVLLVGCFLAFKKRAGIVVIHFGVGLLMFNELWVYKTHVEAQVTLEEEQGGGRPDRTSANSVQDIRELELAIIERLAGTDGNDATVAIPQSLLLRGGMKDDETPYPLVHADELPFDVQVLAFYRNAETPLLEPSEENPLATAGQGRYVKLIKLPPVTGVDKGENQPAAYVRFFNKATSEAISTHLVGVDQWSEAHWRPTNINSLEEVRIDGRTYEVYLRYKRINKSYTVMLNDVHRDNYLGTGTPRDYSSDVHVKVPDTSGGAPFVTSAHIWMNNPLRFRGDTFYQSNYHEAGLFNAEMSTLSVVTNGGWMIPYVCCVIVGWGMLFQFLQTLLRFLTRLSTSPAPVSLAIAGSEPSGVDPGGAGQGGEAPNPRRPKKDQKDRRQPPKRDRQPAIVGAASSESTWTWIVRVAKLWTPVILGVVFLGWVGGRMRPASTPAGGMFLAEAAALPASNGGRIMPWDTLGRNTLRVISGKEEYIDYRVTDDQVSAHGRFMQVLMNNPDAGKPRSPALAWLLEVMSGSPDAEKQRVFRVDNGEVLKTLDLKPRKGLMYSFEEVNQNHEQFAAALKEAREAAKANSRQLSVRHRKLLKLNEQLSLYMALRESCRVPPSDVLGAVDFVVGAAEAQAQKAFDAAPYLAPRDSKEKPWEPLAVAAARAKLQQWARESNAKNLSELQQVLLRKVTVDGRIDQFIVQQFMIDTIENILTNEQGRKRTAEEVRALAVERYRAMPPNVKKTLEEIVQKQISGLSLEEHQAVRQRAREVILSDHETIAKIEQGYQPLLAAALDQLVGDEPLGHPNVATVALMDVMSAARDDDAPGFNAALERYQQAVADAPPSDYRPAKTSFEAFFNHAEPFYYAAVLHFFAFILVCLSWLLALVGWRKPLNWSSLALIGIALVIHTAALIARIYISGKPPVTSLYSSAVFIGWGAVVFGIVIELIFRLGIGNLVASVVGFATLLIAHYLANDGDTFPPLQAVLDTQFWLATHVVCVTLGYMTTFVAGVLGLVYVLCGTCTPVLGRRMRDLSNTNVAVIAAISPAVGAAMAAGRSVAPTMILSQLLGKLIYGVVCFALFFSFVGTVLGGLWADDSWGRFWGWDPKENGALIIVLWNAIVLHARWGGMVKDRGLAVLAIVGNIVTSWSWFGVNELGIGLHSYGFTEGVLATMAIFWATQVVLIIVGSLPKRWWWSFNDGAGQGGAT